MVKYNKALSSIKTYEAGKPIELVVREFGISKDEVVKLASNENPLGTSTKVQEAIASWASSAHLYPDDSMFELKERLSKRFGIQSSELIIGAGSDQVIEFISRALLDESSTIVTTAVTFAMYEIYARQMGAKVVKTASYEHRYDELVEACKSHKAKILYLCTPNNPTGDATTKQEIIRIIEAVDEDCMVVVDGAYMEYAAYKDEAYAITPKELLKYKNVIYLGTFSKAYGLGGMRVGYGIANQEIIAQLYKMRPPFNITTLSLAAAIAACEDEEFIERSLVLHTQQLERYEGFAKEHSIDFIPSATNFITYLFDGICDSGDFSQWLLQRGVIVRNLQSYGLNGIRITVGTEAQNNRFFELAKCYLEQR